jgi:hypothetical protein
VLLILPGLYLAVRWYVAVQATVVEGRRGPASLRRSGELVDGFFRHASLVALVLTAVPLGIVAVVDIGMDAVAESLDSGLVQLAERILVDAALYSFSALSSTLLYFDLRARQGEPFAS